MSTTATYVSTRAYHDAISERARELWRTRGRPEGADVEIWLEAERDLAKRGLIPPAPPTEREARLRRAGESDEINEDELADRLGDFGESPDRSATALDPKRASGLDPST